MLKLISIIIIFTLISGTSQAYLGPGMGGGILIATFGIVIAILAAIFGLVWFPIKRLFKKNKEKKERQNNKID